MSHGEGTGCHTGSNTGSFGRHESVAPPVPGENHYVSVTGNATYAASTNILTPCNIFTAWNEATAGDTVLCRAGTYPVGSHTNSTYHGILIPTNSGTIGNPITFKNYPGELPQLDADSAGSTAWGTNGNIGATILGSNNKNYITYDGFLLTCDGGSGSGKAARIVVGSNDGSAWPSLEHSTTNIIVRNCIVDGGDTQAAGADNAALIRVNKATDCTIEKNKLFDLTTSNGYTGFSGIKSYNGTRIIVKNNEINNCEEGIRLKSGNESWDIHSNFIYDCPESILLTTNSRPARYCKIHNNLLISFSYVGIHIWNESGSPANLGNEVYDNTIVGGTTGIPPMTFNTRGTGSIDNQYYNNITVGVGTSYPYNVAFGLGTPWPEMVYLDFNLYGTMIIKASSITFTDFPTFDNADVLGLTAIQHDNNSLTGNPTFENGSGTASLITDFKLAAGSLGKDNGRFGADRGCDTTTVGIQ
jgi:hypothetical protein